jgi:CobQ/CobB/MinD/ParA nucleotide binding domain
MPKRLMNDKSQTMQSTPVVHLLLQGKGGVGKSLTASLLAQFYKDRGVHAICVDTDPVSRTFSQYNALGTQYFQVTDRYQIDWRRFDSLIGTILASEDSFIVDSGPSTFIPLMYYMVDNALDSVLREANRRLLIHTVITGGQALADTLYGFDSLAEVSKSRSIVVWINEYFGPVEYDGKNFIQMAAFLKNEDKVAGVVLLPRFSSGAFNRDMDEMVERKLTFGEISVANGFTLMSERRLRMIKRWIFEQLDELNLLPGRQI